MRSMPPMYFLRAPGTTTDACCDTSNDCVHSNACYASGDTSVDVDVDGDNDYCNDTNGVWVDCLNSESSTYPTGYFCDDAPTYDQIETPEYNNLLPPILIILLVGSTHLRQRK